MNRVNRTHTKVRYFRASLCVSTFLVMLLMALPVCSQLRTHPAVEILSPNYRSTATVTSLHDFDLKNAEAIIFGGKNTRDLHAHLRRGNYEKHYKIGGDSVGFRWVRYVGSDASDPDYAIAYYEWTAWAGSSSDFGVVQLLHLEKTRINVVQQLLFNMRGSEKAGASFDNKSNTLTIRGVNDWEHCCPTGLDVVRFQLKDGVLKQTHYGMAPLE